MGGYHLSPAWVNGREQGRVAMRQRFDIFKRLPDGSPVFIGSCVNLADALEHLTELARKVPGIYFVYSEEKAIVEVVVHLEAATPSKELSPKGS